MPWLIVKYQYLTNITKNKSLARNVNIYYVFVLAQKTFDKYLIISIEPNNQRLVCLWLFGCATGMTHLPTMQDVAQNTLLEKRVCEM
jgi:hypothetical protein